MDLAIAAALLSASGQLDWEALPRVALAGELALDGSTRPINGALAIAEAAREGGAEAIVLPAENGPEAALADGIEVIPLDDLGRLPSLVAGNRELPPPRALPLQLGASPGGARSRRPARPAAPATRARGRRRGRSQPADDRSARGGQVAGRQSPALDPAAARPRRGARGGAHRQRLRPARRVDAGRATVPRAAPHDQPGGSDRRRHPSASRRGDAGPPGRPLPRRALRVPPRRAGGAAGAAGDRRGLDRAGREPAQPALPLHAGRRLPIPVPAAAAKPIRTAAARRWRCSATRAGSAAPWPTASTSSPRSASRARPRSAAGRGSPRPRCGSG